MAHHPRAPLVIGQDSHGKNVLWLRMSKMLDSGLTNPSVTGDLLSGAITILCETYHGMRTSLSQIDYGSDPT